MKKGERTEDMDLTKLSLSEFLCTGKTKCKEADPNAFLAWDGALDDQIAKEVRSLGSGYAVHEMVTGRSDVVLLHDGKPVGAYWGEAIVIHPDHQGKNLSVPLILAAVEHRKLPDGRTLSKAGKRALTKAWNVANGKEADPWPADV